MFVFLFCQNVLAQDENSPLTADPNVVPQPTEASPVPVTPAPIAPEPVHRTAAELDLLYIEALKAWEQRQYALALERAKEILVFNPNHAQAQLLAGYAMAKLDYNTEAVEMLSQIDVGTDDATNEVRRRAVQLRRRLTERYSREDVSISPSLYLPVDRRGDYLAMEAGFGLTAQAPLMRGIYLRGDWGVSPASSDVSISGSQLGFLGVFELPLGAGRWAMDVAAGPYLWQAKGPFWPELSHWYGGARVAFGLDVRVTGWLGFRCEVGGAFWPGLQRELELYARPVDYRMGMIFWI